MEDNIEIKADEILLMISEEGFVQEDIVRILLEEYFFLLEDSGEEDIFEIDTIEDKEELLESIDESYDYFDDSITEDELDKNMSIRYNDYNRIHKDMEDLENSYYGVDTQEEEDEITNMIMLKNYDLGFYSQAESYLFDRLRKKGLTESDFGYMTPL